MKITPFSPKLMATNATMNVTGDAILIVLKSVGSDKLNECSHKKFKTVKIKY
jgi:hypothetical protein